MININDALQEINTLDEYSTEAKIIEAVGLKLNWTRTFDYHLVMRTKVFTNEEARTHIQACMGIIDLVEKQVNPIIIELFKKSFSFKSN